MVHFCITLYSSVCMRHNTRSHNSQRHCHLSHTSQTQTGTLVIICLSVRTCDPSDLQHGRLVLIINVRNSVSVRGVVPCCCLVCYADLPRGHISRRPPTSIRLSIVSRVRTLVSEKQKVAKGSHFGHKGVYRGEVGEPAHP